jgi:hypothetical protein
VVVSDTDKQWAEVGGHKTVVPVNYVPDIGLNSERICSVPVRDLESKSKHPQGTNENHWHLEIHT